MISEDFEDPPDSSLSDFDKERLANLEVGDKLESETGQWICYRYIDEYLLLDTQKRTKSSKLFKQFKTLQELIHFLLS